MRKTVREQYSDSLRRSHEQLDLIKAAFKRSGDVVGTRALLADWAKDTERVIETYGGPEDAKMFRTLLDLNSPGLTGEIVIEAISKYEELLSQVLQKIPTSFVRRGYSEDLKRPLEQIDEFLERLGDLYRRSTAAGEVDGQTAEDGLRRIKDQACRVLTPLIGEDEAAEIISCEQVVDTYRFLDDLKEDIQKYPHHLLGTGEIRTSGSPGPNSATYVDESRLSELRQINSKNFDFRRLVRLCEELNICWREGAFYAVILIVRAILDHVPPVFGVKSFAEVANNYGGSKSFKEAVHGLEVGARKIGDSHLHTQIRQSESLPNATQVSFAPQLDVLLAEIARIGK